MVIGNDEQTTMRSRLETKSRLSRRSVLRAAAIASASAIAAPYVRDGRAAGALTLGVWDHWVPGANNALTALCDEWGAKNNIEVRIDYITGQGEKDKLTAAAEAQAGTGHDIMSHRDWSVRIHAESLEPLDDVVGELIKQFGPISPVAEYLGKIKGIWRGVPATRGTQVKPCCSRLSLYKEHAGIDLRATTRSGARMVSEIGWMSNGSYGNAITAPLSTLVGRPPATIV